MSSKLINYGYLGKLMMLGYLATRKIDWVCNCDKNEDVIHRRSICHPEEYE